MREIKFRAWDEDGRQMCPPLSLSELIEKFDTGDNIYADGWPFSLPGKLMQYTGLKDKNGTDVYEGDVLKHAQTPKLYPSEVHFSEEFGGYWPLVNTSSGYKPEKWEIIGNIMESPELLK